MHDSPLTSRMRAGRQRAASSAQGILAGVLLLAAGAAWLFPLFRVDCFTEDSHSYMALAESLRRGQYAIAGEPHAKYLPGFPAAIAAMRLLLGDSASLERSAQLTTWVAMLILLPVAWSLANHLSSTRWAGWLAALAIVLHPYVFIQSAIVYPDLLFGLLVLVVLRFCLLERPLSAGLAAGVAALIRYEGFFLLLAVLAWGGGRRQRRWWGVIAGSLLPALWLLRNQLRFSHAPVPYLEEFSSHRAGLGYLADLVICVGIVALLFALIGLLSSRRKVLAPLSFLFLHTVLHYFWWIGGTRFAVQVLPLLLVLAAVGAARLGEACSSRTRRAPGWRRRLSLLLPGALLLSGVLWQSIDELPWLMAREETTSRSLRDCMDYLAALPDSGAVLGADLPGLSLFAGRKAYSAWNEPGLDPFQLLFRYCRTRELRFLVLTDYMAADRRFASFRRDRAFGAELDSPPDRGQVILRPLKTFRHLQTRYTPRLTWSGVLREGTQVTVQVTLYRLSCSAPSAEHPPLEPGPLP